ncbi:required for respiratory growth protein 9, mitochondrial [Cucurbitaria berberidis CBS 394.84]|uniref:Required for respiratory growth protein 9, mitochondrial n=1 Tax=Cucurbitaria berberidis CBS 394.84 TaxID=1168544 RepID=A0A9P4LEU5_9PLEO|nr:required for respiratory growth protein 9, mitochondrial [Cucurbitaria berberidis CBS 394.84]KAF1851722.1 required for respiratory growth protein 9, mitochondrial [Cucurbitaria berberidis CBS 394.84]
MNCHNCARRTLSVFIRSLANVEPVFPLRQTTIRAAQPSRVFSAASQLQTAERGPWKPTRTVVNHSVDEDTPEEWKERPSWQAQKAALKEKLGGEAWNPRKKLSPDTMEGIRHLHETQPERFSTPVLADHFKISPEAIRRILKSKWRPSDEEHEARMQRWDKRGERIWSNLVEMGVKPPKRWRDMGVGRAQNGEKPRWKSRSRNLVDVRDSVSAEFMDYTPDNDVIPIVDGKAKPKPAASKPLFERL